MLTYLISGAVALVLGTGGGFLGGRLANTNLRRNHGAVAEKVDEFVFQHERQLNGLSNSLRDCPTRPEVAQYIAQQYEAMAQVFATREELKPVFKEVITRPELDQALQAVVIGISRNAGLPLPTPQMANETAALAGASGDQLARVIAGLSQQMGQINQQLGLG